jgi:2-keto-4-pentenoate hydratase/2-oxohepta-3-ene-1,7-dioic acid hydratase in catechol pathway
VDFTARDLQDELRGKGLPWEKCKAFDNSAVISSVFTPVENFQDLSNIDFRLTVNDEVRQRGNSADMINGIDAIISYVSKYFTLKIGDLIYTGTPAGVGPVKIGDRLKGYIGDKLYFDFMVK